MANRVLQTAGAECYQCGSALECHVCQLMQENGWKLSRLQLGKLRQEIGQLQPEETGAGVCPQCGVLLGCNPCRLPDPVPAERIHEMALGRTRKSRSAA